MPTTPPRTPHREADNPAASSADEGDIRRGGWILVLVGVLLVLLAIVVLVVF